MPLLPWFVLSVAACSHPPDPTVGADPPSEVPQAAPQAAPQAVPLAAPQAVAPIAAVPEAVAPAPVGLPSWDDVGAGLPPGATDRPRPVLVVTPDRHCFKQWVSPMARGRPHDDRVEACAADCGTEVVCPERADALLAAQAK